MVFVKPPFSALCMRRSILSFRRSSLFAAGLAGSALLCASCGEKPTVSGKKTVPSAAVEPSAAEGREGAPPAPGDKTAESKSPAAAAADLVAGAVMPTTPPTGKTPAAWEGRSAAEEEARLRKEGTWDDAKVAFFEQWGAVDPVSALYAARTGEPGSITVCTSAAVAGWASADEAAARAWISLQPVNYERTLYARAVLDALAGGKSAPAGGWKSLSGWVTEQLPMPGFAQTAAVFVDQWAGEDRAAAYAWTAAQIPDRVARESVLTEQMRLTATRGNDALGAVAEWLKAAEEGLFRDELTLAYIREAARLDPVSTRQWAATIQDETLRQIAEEICAQETPPAAAPEGQ